MHNETDLEGYNDEKIESIYWSYKLLKNKIESRFDAKVTSEQQFVVKNLIYTINGVDKAQYALIENDEDIELKL